MFFFHDFRSLVTWDISATRYSFVFLCAIIETTSHISFTRLNPEEYFAYISCAEFMKLSAVNVSRILNNNCYSADNWEVYFLIKKAVKILRVSEKNVTLTFNRWNKKHNICYLIEYKFNICLFCK